MESRALSSMLAVSLALGLGACTNLIVEGASAGEGDDSASQSDTRGESEGESDDSASGSEEGDEATTGGGFCGDAQCGADEDCMSCALDCGPCSGCGDDLCEAGESCESCPQDCGECDACGNGMCGNGESCESCPQDCGECVCPCGDTPDFDNFCFHPPNTPGCPMTAPGGYCDPNGDGNYDDGDWNQGFFDHAEACA